ncbi:response regulator [Novipirellula aureliae]|uniref:response regulator n=1 Tax=Novipirellula aureliae TaxID=2527966 RepID=UPI0018CECEC0|nr:response regulator [Novipirellula aureliae]
MIADDEQDIREYFERLLPRLGHHLIGQAADGVELLELVERDPPDLIITDVMMPRLDGIQAVEKIAKQYSVPIIMISSLDRPSALPNQFIIDYLVKPFGAAELDAAIKRSASPPHRE